MRPRSSLTLAGVAVLLGGLAPIPPVAAAAETPTCQGRPATMVGDGNPRHLVTGTEGPDVIISNGSAVDAAGGDDLVCVTDIEGTAHILGGDGEDRITTVERVPDVVEANLGAGDDTYVGGPGTDVVDAIDFDDTEGYGPIDSGVNTIRTYAGDDFVSVGDPSGEEVPTDDVDLGRGRDQLVVMRAGVGTASRLVGGSGMDRLDVGESGDQRGERVSLSTRTHTLVRSGITVARWSGFARYVVRENSSDLTVLGGAGPENVRVRSVPRSLTARTGGGDDTLDFLAGTPARIDLGRGHDTLRAEDLQAGSTTIDLRSHTMTTGRLGSDDRVHSSIRSVEDVDTGRAQVVGDRHANTILLGCGRVDAGPGDDVVRGGSCGPLVAYGDAGDDRLVGGYNDDVLGGGPGHDRAVGGPGHDRCVAKRERSCER